jgi:hypothetical protein
METVVNLMWHGRATVDVARAAVNDHRDVELQLPAGFHHAVLVHFQTNATPPPAQSIDVVGGPELLAEIAAIHGLDALGELTDPVQREHARVRVVSPTPKIVITAERAIP